MTEKEIEEGCRKGLNEARKELYQHFAGQMLGIIMRYIANREIAEDLLHDGFIKVFESFNKFTWRGEGSLKAWLYRLFVNTAIEYLRKNKQKTQSLDEIPEPCDDPDEKAVIQIPEDILMQMIGNLPTGYRTIFNLYAIENLSHKTIGQMLHISERTSASQFFHAKQILAHKIKDYLSKKC